MVSLVWGTHALPLDWEVLNQVGNALTAVFTEIDHKSL